MRSLFLLVLLIGFTPAPAGASAAKPVLLVTTYTTQDSGLMDVLVPAFEKKSGSAVKTVAVGSGQAMALGRKGEADVLLVHSPEAELKFMAEGEGAERRLVMHNDFIVVGPAADPAKVRAIRDTSEVFRRIAAAKALFMSRGDSSGTHVREVAIWEKAGIKPDGHPWYQESGQGMGQTLAISDEKAAYTLTDRSTWLALKRHLSLELLAQGEDLAPNVYHVIPVSPVKHPRVNAIGGKAFADFLESAEGQALIGNFGREKYGVGLFVPDAGKEEGSIGR